MNFIGEIIPQKHPACGRRGVYSESVFYRDLKDLFLPACHIPDILLFIAFILFPDMYEFRLV